MTGTTAAAVDDLCACGCGTHLPDGSSLRFASEPCQLRWHNRHIPPADFTAAAAGMQQLGQQLAAGLAQILPVLEALSRRMRAFIEQIQVLEAKQPGPRERAGNAGPRRRMRPPRRIDPRGVR